MRRRIAAIVGSIVLLVGLASPAFASRADGVCGGVVADPTESC